MVCAEGVSMNSSRLRLSLCAIVAGIGLWGTSAASAQVQWKSGTPDAVERAANGNAGATIARLAAEHDRQRVVVRFDRPLKESEKTMLAAKGVRLLNPLGGNAYFATIEQDTTDGFAAAALTPMQSVSAIERDWKLHRDLVNDVIQPWTVIEQKIVDDEFEGAKLEAVVAVYILFHPDVDLEKDGVAIIHGQGGSIRSYIRSLNGFVVEMDYSKIKALAGIDEVQYIEPALPLFDELNAENRVITQVNDVQSAPYSLDGSGVTVLVFDSGRVRSTHGDFGGRVTIGPRDTDGISNHSTHVAGTVGGNGAASAGEDRGMAPGVDILSYGFEVPGGLSQGFLYTDPGDLEAVAGGLRTC